jgi:hypothetical protein
MSTLSNAADTADGAIEFIKQINDFMSGAGAYAGNQSLVTASKHARVEPTMIVDAAAVNLEGVTDTAWVLQSLFSGYYLMAAEMITNIGGVKVRERLAPLNPNRHLDLDLLSYRTARESYATMLPTKANRARFSLEAATAQPVLSEETLEQQYQEFRKGVTDAVAAGTKFTPDEQKTIDNVEATYQAAKKKMDTAKNSKAVKSPKDIVKQQAELADQLADMRDKIKKIKESDSIHVGSSEAGKYANELTTLSVGKIYDVKICNEGKEASVKVGIRVMARTMPSTSVVEMMAHKSALDHDLIERFHGWRAGRLGFFRDLILCQDLIEAHRNAAIRDKSGTYNEIITRNNNAVTAGLLERNPSMAVMSTLAIVARDTLDQIEAKLGGSIDSPRIRNTLFDTTKMMILAVIDPGYETVTFYTHGIAGHSEISIRALKTKKDGADGTMDIMKAFLSGRSPAL